MWTFPKIQKQTETFKKLSTQRQLAWLSALGKPDSDPISCENYRICDAHFISGNAVDLQTIIFYFEQFICRKKCFQFGYKQFGLGADVEFVATK